MLGIGLGGFSKGVDSGYELGTKIQEDREKRQKKDSMRSALTEGQAEYDTAVAAGTEKAGDPDGPMRYAAPRIMKAATESGNVEDLQSASDWLKSDKTRQGSRFFASGMIKGQNGDMAGALKDFVEAGRVQGYGADIEIGDPVPVEGGGISVSVKDKDGNERSQVFKSPDEVMQFGATYLNPEAAFKQWQGTQQAKSEYARDVSKAGDTERGKLAAKTEDEVVRKNLGIGVSAKPGDMISARKQAQAELQNSDGFLDATSSQQAQMIEARAREILGGGTGGAPGVSGGKKVIVDTKTGQLVEVGQ